MADERISGVGVQGDEPKRLGLSDGSKLLLDSASGRSGRVRWRRLGWRRDDGSNEVTVAEARTLAGDAFDEYVRVRTRAEAEWMSAVADWYAEQAAGLRRELAALA